MSNALINLQDIDKSIVCFAGKIEIDKNAIESVKKTIQNHLGAIPVDGVQDIEHNTATRVAINKVKKWVDDLRKDVKSQYMRPYNEAEEYIKDFLAFLDESAKKADEARKEMEEKARIQCLDETRQAVVEYMESKGYSDILPFELSIPDWFSTPSRPLSEKMEYVKNIVEKYESEQRLLKEQAEAEEKAQLQEAQNFKLIEDYLAEKSFEGDSKVFWNLRKFHFLEAKKQIDSYIASMPSKTPVKEQVYKQPEEEPAAGVDKDPCEFLGDDWGEELNPDPIPDRASLNDDRKERTEMIISLVHPSKPFLDNILAQLIERGIEVNVISEKEFLVKE